MNKITITKANLITYQAASANDTTTERIFRTDNLNQLLGYIASKLEDMDVL